MSINSTIVKTYVYETSNKAAPMFTIEIRATSKREANKKLKKKYSKTCSFYKLISIL